MLSSVRERRVVMQMLGSNLRMKRKLSFTEEIKYLGGISIMKAMF
jgi:hypothetical protein